MKDFKTKILFKVCAVIALCAGMTTTAPAAPEAGGAAQLELISENIVGVVLFPDGETPVRNLPVRVWDVQNRKMVHKTKTDVDGSFKIPKTDAQHCHIFIGKVQIDTKLMSKRTGTIQQSHNIVVVLSRPMLIAGHNKMFDVIIAPVIMQPPEAPKIVSP